MPEYFVLTNSFAAPFFSDTDTQYVEADSPDQALEHIAATYQHPSGLYAANAYASADAYHKRDKPLARWLCNHERAKTRLTERKSGYSYLGHGPGRFEINDELYEIADPKAGSLVPVEHDL